MYAGGKAGYRPAEILIIMADETEKQPISAQIKDRLKAARRARDEDTKRVIAMLRTKVLNELKSGKGKEENDELWLEVLNSYAKQLSMVEYEKAGERGEALLNEARFELAFCEEFLPKLKDEAATEAIVRAIAADAGLSGPKAMGRLMGQVMKQHKGEVDPAIVRAVAQRVLAE